MLVSVFEKRASGRYFRSALVNGPSANPEKKATNHKTYEYIPKSDGPRLRATKIPEMSPKAYSMMLAPVTSDVFLSQLAFLFVITYSSALSFISAQYN
jgi:hypothetical protein